jgi:hypothetical protein
MVGLDRPEGLRTGVGAWTVGSAGGVPAVIDRPAKFGVGGLPFDDGLRDMGAEAPPAGGMVIPCSGAGEFDIEGRGRTTKH